MKITKSQLKQIIKEELESVINEDGHTDVPSAIRKLNTATEDAMEILQALEGHHDQELPSWWMSKLTLASDYLNKARDYLLVSSETCVHCGEQGHTHQHCPTLAAPSETMEE